MFDGRDETAADFVPEALAFTPSPLIHEQAKSRTEYVAEIAPRRNRQAIQQQARRLIGSQYAAQIVDRDKPCCKCVQVLPAIVKGDQDVATMALTKQPVLDLRCGHTNQSGRVHLAGDAVRRSINDTGRSTVRRKYGAGGASQRTKSREIVLAAVDDDRTLEEGDCSDAIRAAMRFRPKAARTDIFGLGCICETLISHYIEQEPPGRRESDKEICTGNLVVQRLHFRQRQAAKQDALLLLRSQLAGARHIDRWRPPQIKAQRYAT